MKRGRSLKGVLLLSLIFIIIIATVVFLFFQLRTDRITGHIETGEPINIVFVIKEEEKPLLTEAFLYNPVTKRAAIVDFPLNIGAIIESLKRVDRLSIVYETEGILTYTRKVQDLLGAPLPYFIEIESDDLITLVDLVEGIEIFVANPIELFEENKTILIPSGNVLFDGDKAYQYLIYDDPQELELDRIGRRQKIIQSLIKGIGESKDFITHEEVFSFFMKQMTTNIESRAMMSFVDEISALDTERVVFQRVMGVKRLVDNQELLFPHYEGRLLKQTVKQIIETLASSESVLAEDLYIKVEILNGTKVNGLARRTREIFQSFGFDVVSIDNAEDSEVENTVIYDRVGDISLAQRAADIIQCTQVLTQIDPESSAYTDVTIVLGKDFDGRYCKN